MHSKFKRLVAVAGLALATSFIVAAPADAAMKISQAAGGEMISALGALADGGTLKIYCGTQPSNPDTALSGNTLAATFTFNSPGFGSASLSSGKMKIAADFAATTVTAAASCTASFGRILESDGTTVVADVTVGTSGADVNLNSTSITSGGNVTLTSFNLGEPVD
jgi:hypothetical protein